MAGMLTVVNPDANPSRRKHHRRRKARRGHARATTHRRRRSINPFPRRAHRRRRPNARRHHRRRRHINPIGMGGMVGTLTKGLSMGFGAIVTNATTNGINYLIKGGKAGTGTPLTGLAKTGLKAAVGLIALPMALRLIPGGRRFATPVAIGAGIAVALDLYDEYIKKNLPEYLQDYQYGTLNAYRSGQLEGWAPQAGMSGGNVYDEGVYS